MARKPTPTPTPPPSRLRELRAAAGLSQGELARALGVSQQNIAYWERRQKPPRSDVLPAMAAALGVSVHDLLGEGESVAAPSRPGRPGAIRQLFEEVALLPRRQQAKVAEVVSALLKQYRES